MKKSFIVGALIGGVAAGATALFIAPKKGSQLREDAQDKFVEVKEKAQEAIAKLKEKRSAANEIQVVEDVVAATSEEAQEEVAEEQAS